MMNAKKLQNLDNVHRIRKNYVLKSIYDDKMNASMTCNQQTPKILCKIPLHHLRL